MSPLHFLLFCTTFFVVAIFLNRACILMHEHRLFSRKLQRWTPSCGKLTVTIVAVAVIGG